MRAIVRPIPQCNWFTKLGALAKRKQLEQKGIPDLKYWKFITLTLDPKKVGNHESGMHYGKARMKRFYEALDNKFGFRTSCMKMEFHKSGAVHWHIMYDYKKKFTKSEMAFISDAWGLGRINIKANKCSNLDYMWKYVTKGGTDIPDWFMDGWHDGKTYEKTRFWSARKGFYTGAPAKAKEKKPKKTSHVYWTVRELYDSIGFRASVCFNGKTRTLKLNNHYSYLLNELVNYHKVGGARYIGQGYELSPKLLKPYLYKWQLIPITN